MSEPRRKWPPHFDEWPREAQVQLMSAMYNRDELMRAIGERQGIKSLLERHIDRSNARFTKPELAELAVSIGAHRADPYLDDPDP